MRVIAVPNLKDNYAYLVIASNGRDAAIVDPGEAPPIEAAIAAAGVRLTQIWCTHHHADHTGGVAALVAAHPGLEVIAGTVDAAKVPQTTRKVEDRDVVELDEIRARIIHNPGHTLGAISFYIEATASEPAAVFTGDTLFAAGCGRVFEGTPPQMHESLHKLAALPAATRVYFGHEYTAANLKFAAAVEPGSVAIQARVSEVAATRARGEFTTPSLIASELATNPFLRTAHVDVLAAARARDASATDAVAAFATVRTWKNEFKG